MNELDRPPGPAGGDIPFLSSWKEIAAHLVVSVKTAQRYENELGLPIKRRGGRVSITLPDLLAWQDPHAGKQDDFHAYRQNVSHAGHP